MNMFTIVSKYIINSTSKHSTRKYHYFNIIKVYYNSKTLDYISKLNNESVIPKWPESSEQLTSVDRLFSLKPSITSADEEEEIDTEGLPESYNFLEDEENDEPNPSFRLGRHILKLGKIHYRHEEVLTTNFKERKQKICDYRTVPQIRRCLKDWMIKSDRDEQYLYRTRKIGWNLS